MAFQFRIAARALRQIGAELISSDEIALNELIKNAFDARSPQVKILVSNPLPRESLRAIRYEIDESLISTASAISKIKRLAATYLVEDDDSELREEIYSYFSKCQSSRRTLLDGIDNFFSEAYYIRITDNGKGMSRDDLENVFLVIGTPYKLEEKFNPADDKPILGEKGIGRLSMMRLGSVANIRSSKFGEWHEICFDWRKFDDPNLFLGDINVSVLPCASPQGASQTGTHVEIRELYAEWTNEKVFSFINLYLRRIQDPFSKGATKYPVEVYFNGKKQYIPGLPVWLKKAAQLTATFKYRPLVEPGSVALRREIRWENSTTAETREWSLFDLSNQLKVPIDVLEDIGPWDMNCLWFNRKKLKSPGSEKNSKEIADELNVWCGGISIYRDNFRIGKTGGMEDDWLEWDSKALKTKGYTLNRYQTVGSLAVGSKNNIYLVDTANRENLVSCQELDALKLLLSEIVVNDVRSHINVVQEAEIKKAISAETTEASAREAETSLKRALENVRSIEKTIPAEDRKQLAEIKDVIRGQIDYVKTLKRSFEMAQEKRIELLELAGIGLVIEKALHELDRITERTVELLDTVEKGADEMSVGKLLVRLRSQVVATNKRIRSVNALSPSGRNRKEEFNVAQEVISLVETYSARAERLAVKFVVITNGADKDNRFIVRASRGLLAQVLENLFTNSIYWVEQGLKEGEDCRTIWVEIDPVARVVMVRDNGPGIDPRYQFDIFKPYFSTRHKGKGLGLYIAAELAEYHGGKLYLSPTEDDDGRLREFILELPK